MPAHLRAHRAAAGGPGAKSHLPQAVVKRPGASSHLPLAVVYHPRPHGAHNSPTHHPPLVGYENRVELLQRILPLTPDVVAQLPHVFLTAKHNRRRCRFLFNPPFTFTSSNPNRVGKVSPGEALAPFPAPPSERRRPPVRRRPPFCGASLTSSSRCRRRRLGEAPPAGTDPQPAPPCSGEGFREGTRLRGRAPWETAEPPQGGRGAREEAAPM